MTTESQSPPKKMSLPEKPSDLIEVAVKDLELCERDKRYKINMSFWHRVHDDTGVCDICLAGALISQTLGVPPCLDSRPNHFPKDVDNKLSALDMFRQGNLCQGLWRLGHDVKDSEVCPPDEMLVNVPDYGVNPTGFKKAMRDMANRLRGRGL